MKSLIIILIAISITSCVAERVSSEDSVKKTVVTMVNAIDTKDWEITLDQFDKTVFVDYESLSGQSGSLVSAKDLVGNWEKLLMKATTHHMLTNFAISVDGNKAEVFSHVYASHNAKNIRYWDVYGRYHHKLKKTENGWRITFMKLIIHGQKGNKYFLEQVNK